MSIEEKWDKMTDDEKRRLLEDVVILEEGDSWEDSWLYQRWFEGKRFKELPAVIKNCLEKIMRKEENV